MRIFKKWVKEFIVYRSGNKSKWMDLMIVRGKKFCFVYCIYWE